MYFRCVRPRRGTDVPGVAGKLGRQGQPPPCSGDPATTRERIWVQLESLHCCVSHFACLFLFQPLHQSFQVFLGICTRSMKRGINCFQPSTHWPLWIKIRPWGRWERRVEIRIICVHRRLHFCVPCFPLACSGVRPAECGQVPSSAFE